jgi:2-polyprenyl-3-methyl-5-hydroxy-6-metoxy-1,4-benzoquinol methylase
VPNRRVSDSWNTVDQTDDAESFVAYLDDAAQRGRDRRLENLWRLEVGAGDAALDVGCGAGDLVIDLASEIAPGVRAVGVDASEAMIATARDRAAQRGVEVEFEVGDAHSLVFESGTFDGVHCTRVLQHLDDPGLAVREMARVLKPGGRLVVSEPDWDAFVLDSDDVSIALAVRAALGAVVRQPDVGRRLRRFAASAGLEPVEFTGVVPMSWSTLEAAIQVLDLRARLDEAISAGTVRPEAALSWWQGLERDDRDGVFTMAVVVFRLIAQKPSRS